MVKEKEKRTTAVFYPTDTLILIELQKYLKKRYSFDSLTPSSLHLTYIHFGRLSEFYGEIRSFSNISRREFYHTFRKFVRQTTADYIEEKASVIGIRSFGPPERRVLAVELELSQDVLIARDLLVDTLLDDMRVDKKYSWEKRSRIFNWDRNMGYRPHITLGQSNERLLSATLRTSGLQVPIGGIYMKNVP